MNAPIPVIGCGGGGCGIVSLLEADAVLSPVTVNLSSARRGGPTVSMDARGMTGCKGDPFLGWAMADSNYDDILAHVLGKPAVIVVATLGGGTGSGVLEAVLDRIDGDCTRVLAVVGIPFSFEGGRRERASRELRRISAAADCTIVFDMDRLAEVVGDDVGLSEALDAVGELMRDAVHRLADLLEGPFASLFPDPSYTVSYAASADPDAVLAALDKGYSSADPADGRIVIHLCPDISPREADLVARTVCDRTGIYPETVRGSGGTGMMMFIPSACRAL